MKLLFRSSLVSALIIAAPLSQADDQPGYIDRARAELKLTYELGDTEVYLPFRTWHAPWAYTSEQVKHYQNWPVGFGIGRGRYDDKGDWHGVYAMGFQDSHYLPEWIAGYGWKTYWPIASSDVRLGLGYTAGFTTRADYAHYFPVPLLLPIASLDYRTLSVESAYVPGGKGNGNVFFIWAKWRTDGKSPSDWVGSK